MSTTKQKKAARKNLEKARAAGTERKKGATSSKGDQLSTADKNDLPATVFAFPEERKEPLNDAKHVRNAIARFGQVQGVSDAERAKAWKRIKKAAKKHDVDVEASSWRELMPDGTAGRSRTSSAKKPAKKKGSAKKGSAKKESAKKESAKRTSKKQKAKA